MCATQPICEENLSEKEQRKMWTRIMKTYLQDIQTLHFK